MQKTKEKKPPKTGFLALRCLNLYTIDIFFLMTGLFLEFIAPEMMCIISLARCQL